MAPGERLVWCGPNSLQVVAANHAARKLRMVAVPLSYRFTAEEMAYVIDNSDATCVVADAEFAGEIASIADRCPKVRTWLGWTATVDAPALPAPFRHWDDVLGAQPDTEPAVDEGLGGAQMIYTSGTTGKPKGAMRTAADPALTMALLNELDYLHPDGVHLTTGPMYHSGPLAFASLAGQLGHKVVLLRKFDAARWLELVTEHRVTNTFSAPTQLKRIVSLPDEALAKGDCSSMVTLIANAAPVPYALKQEVFAKLGTTFLYEVYGSTELGVDTVMKPEDQLRKPGSCGRPYGTHRAAHRGRRRHAPRRPAPPASCSSAPPSPWTATTPPTRPWPRTPATAAAGSPSATWPTWTTRASSTSATARRTWSSPAG